MIFTKKGAQKDRRQMCWFSFAGGFLIRHIERTCFVVNK